MTPQTIEELRALGWSDEDILNATHIIGFFNYYTRLPDALGVEPEDFMRGRKHRPQRGDNASMKARR